MGLEYVDIFYHHRPDPQTPLAETMQALNQIVRSGRALYVGISNYPAELTRKAANILKSLGTPCLIHQPKYNMYERWVEKELLKLLGKEGIGCIAFSPLVQGLLTDKYFKGIPHDSRAANPHGFLNREDVMEDKISKSLRLDEIAQSRGQKLSQMALAWILRNPEITSVLIGARRISHIDDAVTTLNNLKFTHNELRQIKTLLGSK
jgi:L-glyceraldehyde 3-phosphate reductase